MLEIILGIGVCFAVAKAADADELSGVIWFMITFGLCAAALAIPLPFLRFLIAGAVAFVLMIVYKVSANK